MSYIRRFSFRVAHPPGGWYGWPWKWSIDQHIRDTPIMGEGWVTVLEGGSLSERNATLNAQRAIRRLNREQERELP